ncbi:monovalent cation/H+ antiporter subunit D [Cellvibrio japonicus]|uniref:PhaD protein n=1 Tax=Cellvibrio japonicus (strain Ueda107) TaxID=498211 RepID=B3PFD2_CELJU|nr:monovalent cation/H+ antiporter subunit D [Cellvibrio japonicus]ACE84849.1 PhaD protein [Cellvibrio japonicus Ueda107]QEI10805.1 monovalent cation/H+ antiporter subunit D [Cellvibrio japonicus]QEI14381.1 monovalent cation/H+ antiporter subunit D [Cellvibrio japonicus]QEI17959.1 monovalent cation/H+ antiporter subunit D [Cellvibrio japonicus]
MNHLIIAPILLPLATAVLLILLTGRSLVLIRRLSLGSSALLLGLCTWLLLLASDGQIHLYDLGNWQPPFGILLVLDRLSALMLLVTAILAFFSLAYAVCGNDQPGDNLHGLVHFLLLGVNGAFLTGDLFNLFVFFEVLLIASYALLLHGRGPERARAGLHYVVINLAGSALFLIAVSALYGITGSLNMADLASKIANLDPADAPLAAAAGMLLLVVFGLKAAIAPLYFWLPRAYAAASAPVAALFAIMTKVGVYTIIRVYTLVFGNDAGALANLAWPWLWPLALVTLALGLVGALAARELRTQIAYLVVVSVGTLLAGVSLNSEAALSASLYYLVHSTFVCGALFLLADLILRQRGECSDRITRGPRLRQPALLGGLFFVGAVSVIGLPPLSGFIGKLLLLSAADTGVAVIPLWVILLVGSLVTLMALSRSGSTFFWRTDASESPTVVAADKGALLAVVLLLGFSLLLSVAGAPLLDYTRALAQQQLAPDNYIQAVQAFQTR